MTYENEPTRAAVAARAEHQLAHVRAELPQIEQLVRAAILGAQTLAEGAGAEPAVREEMRARFTPALEQLGALLTTVTAGCLDSCTGATEYQQPGRMTFVTQVEIERRYLERRPLSHLRAVPGCGRSSAQEYAAASDLPDDGPEPQPPPEAA